MRRDPFVNTPDIAEGAIFVADSHYNPLGRTEILPLLRSIAAREIKTRQLFLMGDISDLLIGKFKFCREENRELIALIDRVAKNGTTVYYFEGNHDFFLDEVFDQKVIIIPKKDQPAEFLLNDRKILLLHGDFRVEFRYAVYAKAIRNPVGLFLFHLFSLNFVNFWLLKYMQKKLLAKQLAYNIENFQGKRTRSLCDLGEKSDMIVEGHFHQGCDFDCRGARYLNIAAYALEQSFVQIEYDRISGGIVNGWRIKNIKDIKSRLQRNGVS
jgi:UDP-2,3-diacylglucosamine hydrolase